MNLSRVLILFITCLVSVLMIANGVASVINTRSYFSNQMQVLSQDAATILGLSISKAAKEQDQAQIESTIDAVFDSGFYRSIVYVDVSGTPKVTRIKPINIEGIPDWFISIMDIPTAFAQAEVISGWFQSGKVHVTSHPGYAYQELWRVLKAQTVLTILTLLVGYFLSGIGLRLVLRPLQQITRYSEKIAEGDFTQRIHVSFINEINFLANSMNRMNLRIRAIVQEHIDRASKLQREFTRDSLTGLMNRTEFDHQISYWLKDAPAQSSCLLIVIQLKGLDALNNEQGRMASDDIIQHFSAQLFRCAQEWQPVWVARHSGTEFSVFIPGIFESDVLKLSQRILTGVLPTIEYTSMTLPLAAVFANSDFSLSELMSGADSALRRVESESPIRVVNLEKSEKAASRPARDWLSKLRAVVSQRAVILQHQEMHTLEGGELFAVEFLARVQEDNDLISASAFWPLVERYNLSESLDRIIVEKAFDQIKNYPGTVCSINLSNVSLKSDAFNQWLREGLLSVGALAEQVVFEVKAEGGEGLSRFFENIDATAANVAFQDFGRSPEGLALLETYKPAFVKFDQRFSKQCESDAGMRFYVQSLIQIVHNCGVKMVATGIESEAQCAVFKELGVIVGQGFYISSIKEVS